MIKEMKNKQIEPSKQASSEPKEKLVKKKTYFPSEQKAPYSLVRDIILDSGKSSEVLQKKKIWELASLQQSSSRNEGFIYFQDNAEASCCRSQGYVGKGFALEREFHAFG